MVDTRCGDFMELKNVGTESLTESFYEKFSPTDGKFLYKVPLSREKNINEVFTKANLARQEFQNKGIFARSLMLDKALDRLSENREKIIELVSKETGKSRYLSESEFDTTILFGRSLAGFARFQEGILIPSSNSKKTVIEKRIPLGIAVLVVSYNTPLPNYAWKVFPSFLSGNISILKPSEHTSGSAQLFVEAFENLDTIEKSVFLIHGDALTGELIVSEEFELLSFTGSYQVGLKIQIKTANKMRKNIFELGGNNCLIINKNSNIELAIDAVINSAFSNAGQRCAAGSRLIVHKDIAEIVVSNLKSKISKLDVGLNQDSMLGPVIDSQAVNRFQKFISDCQDQNFVVTSLGHNPQSTSMYVNPTLVEGFSQNDELFKCEVFSPILRIAVFEDRNHALALANNSNYQLTAAVWSNEIEEINFYVDKIKAGLINVNGPTHGSEFQFPFGGIGNSGNSAKEVGYQCLDQYSHHKVVTTTTYE